VVRQKQEAIMVTIVFGFSIFGRSVNGPCESILRHGVAALKAILNKYNGVDATLEHAAPTPRTMTLGTANDSPIGRFSAVLIHWLIEVSNRP
jgi:hypothetical protein